MSRNRGLLLFAVVALVVSAPEARASEAPGLRLRRIALTLTTERGYAAARADLFAGRPFFLVPTARSDERSMQVAGDLARAVGAVPTVVSAAEHDRIVAVLSGLPLLVARALARVGAEDDRRAGHRASSWSIA